MAASFLSFDSGMNAGKRAPTDNVEWYVHANHAGRFGHSMRASHASFDERRANSLALIITTSLLFVLFASALMVGGHAIISPLLRAAPASGDVNRRGDIVYTMPDGMFCQHMTFDNSTGRIAAGGIDRCDPGVGSEAADRRTGFKWGVH